MKRLALAILFSSIVSPAWATTYFLAPAAGGGNDANSGTSANAPWLTPNHAVNCGDVIIAAPSTAYVSTNFYFSWGAVTCPSNNNVAWLECATPFACALTVTTGTAYDMVISASYWGVQGWVFSNLSSNTSGGGCVTVNPASANISHVILANNIVNNCNGSGIGGGPNGTASVDYLAVIGNVVYNVGALNTGCDSGISINAPEAVDNLPGTHVYVAGNIVYGSKNPSGCFDGEGIIFDTWNSFAGGPAVSYAQQGVIDNNIAISNGGSGIRVEYNNAGMGAPFATIYVRHNTMWGNDNDALQSGSNTCGEYLAFKTENTSAYQNLSATNQPGCFGNSSIPAYAYNVQFVDGTSSVYQNAAWSSTGSYTGSSNATGFTFNANNITSSTISFANATTPGAPNCSGFATVPTCMATVIANFTPTTAAAKPYGYQVPTSTQTYDPLFPHWLCNVNLPPGLVTMGCVALSSLPASPSITGLIVQ